jgi:hypothetical protein
MKKYVLLLLVVLLINLYGCQTTKPTHVGMSKNRWLKQTFIADEILIKDEWEVWKSGKGYYYFKNNKLEHVDRGEMAVRDFKLEVERSGH